MDQPYKLESVILFALVSDQTRKCGYQIKYELLLNVVNDDWLKVCNPLDVFLVRSDEFQSHTDDKDDINPSMELEVAIWLRGV